MENQIKKTKFQYAFWVAPIHVLLACTLPFFIYFCLEAILNGKFIDEIITIFSSSALFLLYSLIVAYVHSLLIALPLLLLIQKRKLLSKKLFSALGFFVGYTPSAIAVLLWADDVLPGLLLLLVFGIIGAMIGFRFGQIATRPPRAI